jgi:hypothetical protein
MFTLEESAHLSYMLRFLAWMVLAAVALALAGYFLLFSSLSPLRGSSRRRADPITSSSATACRPLVPAGLPC